MLSLGVPKADVVNFIERQSMINQLPKELSSSLKVNLSSLETTLKMQEEHLSSIAHSSKEPEVSFFFPPFFFNKQPFLHQPPLLF
jgi:hypothetical protein